MKKLDKKTKRIILIAIISMMVILLLVLVTSLLLGEKQKQEIQNKQYVSVQDFKSIKEIVTYMGCEYKKEKKSSEDGFSLDIYLKFKVDLYTDENSNEIFYNRIINLIAEFNHYKNFRLIDDEKKLLISVVCDEQNQTVIKKLINGEENYFEKINTQKNLEKYGQKQITNFEIQSNELKELINQQWRYTKVNLGNKTSTFQNYDIYFEKGIEVRNIGKQTFNLIFKANYQEPIVNGMKVGTKLEQIQTTLGEPTFGSLEDAVLGYRGKDFYIFFYLDEIVIYRVDANVDTTKFVEAMAKFKEEKQVNDFLNRVTDIWPDYDSYTKASDLVELKYTTKGIDIIFTQYGSSGVFFYNNYTGYITENATIEDYTKENKSLPEFVYIESQKDLVYEQEKNRRINQDSMLYYSGYYEQLEDQTQKTSQYFATVPGEETIGFYSIDKKEANSEIKGSIDNGKWMDDLHFVYGITGKGLYLYNPRTRQNVVLIEGSDNYQIQEIEENVVKYDSKKIQVNY